MAKPKRSLWARKKLWLHRYFDPLLAWRHGQRERRALGNLPDGEYRVPLDVPYVSQFASPRLIAAYIHDGYDGTQDPAWQSFGAPQAQDYAFWAPRVCSLAVIRMAVQAHDAKQNPTLWELVELGLKHDGFRVYDEKGQLVDEGWFFAAQVALAERFGLNLTGYSYASHYGILRHICEGHLVSVTVSPELGERQPRSNRYGGHAVLAHGFRWQGGDVTHIILHNPSGRYPELQADAVIPIQQFLRWYAYRYATFTPIDRV